MGKCVKCERLWAEYAAAVMSHVRLQGQLKVAVYSSNTELSNDLSQEVARAAAKRDAAHLFVQQHEDCDHTVEAAQG